jgi:hypothetical protein
MNNPEKILRKNLNEKGIVGLDQAQTEFIWKEIDIMESSKGANVARFIDEVLRNNDFKVSTLLNRVNLSDLLIRAKSSV